MDRGRPRESERCSLTCTCNAIYHSAGDRGCEDRICNWRPFRAYQKAACGVIPHPVCVNCSTKYNTKLAVFHKSIGMEGHVDH